MDVVAVIPARAGSQRIQRKALQTINGQTLISRTIELCKAANIFRNIIVSTDSEDIANEARLHDIEVPFLRKMYADSISSVSQATTYSLEQYSKFAKIQARSIVVQVMPNCPFVSFSTVSLFVETFANAKKSVPLLSCVKIDPLARFSFEFDSGEHRFIFPYIDLSRGTDTFPNLYTPSGAVWVSNFETLLSFKSFYSPGYQFREINSWEGFDIDTEDQLSFAKANYEGISRFINERKN